MAAAEGKWLYTIRDFDALLVEFYPYLVYYDGTPYVSLLAGNEFIAKLVCNALNTQWENEAKALNKMEVK